MAKRVPARAEVDDTHELYHLQDEWKWFSTLGVVLMILGLISVLYCWFASEAAVVLFGVLILAGGVVQVVNALWAGKWSGFLLNLLIGIIYVVVGLFMVDDREHAVMILSALLAAFFIVSGIFRIAAALSIQFPGWGWALLSGMVAILLGVMIYKGWPDTGEVIIGLFIGIEMIFNGWYWVMLGSELKERSAA